MDSKVQAFNKELSYIKDIRLKDSIVILINKIPDYFFIEPASSTGKYHPDFSQGAGGLLRHTKAAVRIAYELLSTKTIGEEFSDHEKDLIIISIILHDSVKRGDNEKHTRFDHPLLASKLVKDNKDLTFFTDKEIDLICSMIETHMGQWTIDHEGNELLDTPKTKCQKFVHMCDYLSSKKFLNVKFINNDIMY